LAKITIPIKKPTKFAAGHRDCPGNVEVAVARLDAALRDDPLRQSEDERSDRDVDEEDPLPAEVLDEDAAEQHAGGRAGAAERAPDPEGLVSLGPFGERRRHDRERGGGDDRCPETLDGPRRD
jgi:hypothetical protein